MTASVSFPSATPPGTSSPPMEMPRGLIFLTALWLVGSWGVAMGLNTPVHASSASYEPGVRLMLQCVVLGFIIGWPLLRLSQTVRPAPVRHVMLDLVVLLTLMQVVVWLPRLLTNWLVVRTAALDAAMAGWVVLIGAVVASAAHSSNPLRRTVTMMVCVMLCLLGPLVAWFGLHVRLDRPDLISLGPFMTVRELTEGGSVPPRAEHWRGIVVLWGVALGAWLLVFIQAAIRGRVSGPRSSEPG